MKTLMYVNKVVNTSTVGIGMKLPKKLESMICNNFLDKGCSVLFVWFFFLRVLFFARHQ